jgi:molybdate transport system substrate-binding protein
MCHGAHASNISVLSSGATRTLLTQAGAEFNKLSGHSIVNTVAVSPMAVRDRIHAGEVFDIAMANSEFVEELENFGDIHADTRECVAQSALGVAVKAGAPKPNIKTRKKFKKAMLAAATVAYATEGTSGAHLLQVFKDLGIEAQMAPKLRPMTGPAAVQAVANGQVEMAALLTASIVPAAATVDLVGTLPKKLEFIVTFDAAVPTKSAQPDTAASFIEFLTSEDSEEVLENVGMEPCDSKLY